jgi:hypothetical protein
LSFRGHVPILTLDARLDARVGNGVTVAFTVTNPTTEHVELTFRDARTADVVVRAEGDVDRGDGHDLDVVWRWSDERAFDGVIRTQRLEPGEQASDEMIRTDPHPGSDTAVATLSAGGTSVHAQKAFEV